MCILKKYYIIIIIKQTKKLNTFTCMSFPEYLLSKYKKICVILLQQNYKAVQSPCKVLILYNQLSQVIPEMQSTLKDRA